MLAIPRVLVIVFERTPCMGTQGIYATLTRRGDNSRIPLPAPRSAHDDFPRFIRRFALLVGEREYSVSNKPPAEDVAHGPANRDLDPVTNKLKGYALDK